MSDEYGPASSGMPGATPRSPYLRYAPPLPVVLCAACGTQDEWVHQFHCRTCGAPVKKRIG